MSYVDCRRLGFLALTAAFACLSAVSATGQGNEEFPHASSGCPVTLYFGNGINTDEADAYWTAHYVLGPSVNEALREAGRKPLPWKCIDYAYATNFMGVFGGLIESFDQAGDDASTSFWEMFGGLLPANSRFAEAIEDHVAEEHGEQFEESADLRRQVSHFRSQLDDAAKTVLVVAHSQGNFYANEAFRALTMGLDGLTPIEPPQFRIVAVATPAGFVATGDDNHVTLYGDVILAALGRLPANTDNGGPPCQISVLGPDFPGAHASAVACHSFDSSYLAGSVSRKKILEAATFNLPVINVIARDDLYRVLQGAELTGSVVENDMLPITLDGTVAWGYVEWLDLITSALSVDSAGRFTVNLASEPNVTGEIQFHYQIHTPFGDSEVATVRVQIEPIVTTPAPIELVVPTKVYLPWLPGEAVARLDAELSGGLLAVTTYGRVWSVNSDGSLSWTIAGLRGPWAQTMYRRGRIIRAGTRAIIASDTSVSSIDTGSGLLEWTVVMANGFTSLISANPAIDPLTGTVFVHSTRSASNGLPVATVSALDRTGAIRWHRDVNSGGMPMFRGNDGNIYVVGFESNAYPMSVFGFNPVDGDSVCQVKLDSELDVRSNTRAVVTASGLTVLSHGRIVSADPPTASWNVVTVGPGCAVTAKSVTTAGDWFLLDASEQQIYVSEVPLVKLSTGNLSYSASDAMLLALSPAGDVLWRNTTVRPHHSVSDQNFQPVGFGDRVYATGFMNGSTTGAWFTIDALTGQTIAAVLFGDCGYWPMLTADAAGSVYLGTANSLCAVR